VSAGRGRLLARSRDRAEVPGQRDHRLSRPADHRARRQHRECR
jgi:hypothetical protein